jgi:septal ring factor EnvC (AmiA/AmiB activator)
LGHFKNIFSQIYSEKLEQSKRTISQLESDLSEKERQLDDITCSNEDEMQKLKDHNSALYDQLQTMGAELSALKHGTISERENLLGEGTSQLNLSTYVILHQCLNSNYYLIHPFCSISNDENQSSEQLMQVIRFLRREKDAACLQAEEYKTKLADAKARYEIAEQQVGFD